MVSSSWRIYFIYDGCAYNGIRYNVTRTEHVPSQHSHLSRHLPISIIHTSSSFPGLLLSHTLVCSAVFQLEYCVFACFSFADSRCFTPQKSYTVFLIHKGVPVYTAFLRSRVQDSGQSSSYTAILRVCVSTGEGYNWLSFSLSSCFTSTPHFSSAERLRFKPSSSFDYPTLTIHYLSSLPPPLLAPTAVLTYNCCRPCEMPPRAPAGSKKARGKMPRQLPRPSPETFLSASRHTDNLNAQYGSKSTHTSNTAPEPFLIGLHGDCSLAPDRTRLCGAEYGPGCK